MFPNTKEELPVKAWIYQDGNQLKKHGKEKTSWYVGWYDPEGGRHGQSCGPGTKGHKKAEQLQEKISAQLLTGTYETNSKKTWEEFRKEYEDKVLPGLAITSRSLIITSLDTFERIVRPKRMSTIKTNTIDEFTAKRRQESGKKRGDLISPASVNKDLRHIRAALKKAHRWGYITSVPCFDMEKEPFKLPTYVTPEHFAIIYKACDNATIPSDQPYPASEWWRGLLVMGYMTGWRISDMLGLRREDLDLDAETAITR